MKSYNIQNYIRYKQDLEKAIKRLEKKEYYKYTYNLQFFFFS